MRLAVIVPMAGSPPDGARNLSSLGPLRRRGHRLVVVNAGANSGAGSDMPPVDRHVYAPAGWARQANAGSRAPEVELADALVFLPPDVELPPLADRSIARALANSTSPWGGFDIRYEDPTGLLRVPLVLAAAIANAGARLTGICLREQAIFVSRGAFLALEGFTPVDPQADRGADAVSDAEFSRRARLLGAPITLREAVRVPLPARTVAPLVRAVWRRERARWAIALGLAGHRRQSGGIRSKHA